MCYKAFVVEDNRWTSNKCIFTLLMNIKSPQNTQNLVYHYRIWREFNHHLYWRNRVLSCIAAVISRFLALMRRTKYKSNLTQLWPKAYVDLINTIKISFKLIHWIIKSIFQYFLPNCNSLVIFHRTLLSCLHGVTCVGLSQSWPVYKHILRRDELLNWSHSRQKQAVTVSLAKTLSSVLWTA